MEKGCWEREKDSSLSEATEWIRLMAQNESESDIGESGYGQIQVGTEFEKRWYHLEEMEVGMGRRREIEESRGCQGGLA